jgi:hypothetical protein
LFKISSNKIKSPLISFGSTAKGEIISIIVKKRLQWRILLSAPLSASPPLKNSKTRRHLEQLFYFAIVGLHLISKKVNNMEPEVNKVQLHEIQDLRNLFLQENTFQFVHDKCHGAGWADTYIFSMGNDTVGYGSVWGREDRNTRDTIFEFYLLDPFRKFTNIIFPKFRTVSAATFIECQTNNPLQSAIFFEYAQNIATEAILFADSFQTQLSIPDTSFRNTASDKEGPEYVLEQKGQIVASGGYVRNYIFPILICIMKLMKVKETRVSAACSPRS